MPSDEPIRLVPPEPSWPVRFELERAFLEQAIGEWVEGGIHHVGSTAVARLGGQADHRHPGGGAQPRGRSWVLRALADLGYLYAPYPPDEMHWFCKPDPARRTHHLHLVTICSEALRPHSGRPSVTSPSSCRRGEPSGDSWASRLQVIRRTLPRCLRSAIRPSALTPMAIPRSNVSL